MSFLRSRLPDLKEIIPVYAVGMVMLYTFSLWFSFQDFTRNWMLYLETVDIIGVFAYIVSGAFIESLITISALALIYFILPQAIARGRFVLYGSILTFTFFLALMLRDGTYAGISDILKNLKMVYTFFAGSALVLAVLAEFFHPARAFIESFAERCVVFLYIYLPLSVVALAIVALRNIGW